MRDDIKKCGFKQNALAYFGKRNHNAMKQHKVVHIGDITALRFLSRFVENLQGGFIRMEDFSFEQLRMQPVIYGSEIILCGPQNPVGHGLTAQLNAFAVYLLLLPVQGGTHNKLLRHDIGNGFRGGKAAGDNILLPGCFHNRRLAALVSIFAAAFAGIGVVNILPNDILGRDNLQCLDHFLPDLGHSISALRADQLLTLQTVFHLFGGDSLRDGVQCVGMLLAPLVAGHIGGFRILFFRGGEYLGFVEQEAHLLHD